MLAPESDEDDECSGSADLMVFPKGIAKETQRIHLESICIVGGPGGGLLVSSAQRYDAQGTLVVDDFDFDGREDLAIQVSHHGPYGGPTFRVFLGLATPGEFAFSPELSSLTVENLGFFQVERKRERLVTHAKNGCCFHLMQEHTIVKGKPRSVLKQAETLTPVGDVLIETQTLVDGRWRKSSRREPAQE